MSPSFSERDGQIRLLHEELALHWVVASGRAADLVFMLFTQKKLNPN